MLRQVIMAQANCIKPKYELEVFSYLTYNFLNLFNHECRRSTTQRLALNPMVFFILSASFFLELICGI